MPRTKLIISNQCVYHVTNRSNNREWFYIPIADTWDIFCKILGIASGLYGAEIHSFVLMENHYHLLAATRMQNLHLFMRYFQTEVCREIQRHSGRINHVFGTRYKWSALWTSFSYGVVTKYVLRNPVKAGIVPSVESYEYSSIHRNAIVRLPLIERIDAIASQVPRDRDARLTWLNMPTSREADELVRRGLHYSQFKLAKGSANGAYRDLVAGRYGVNSEN